MNTDNSSGRLSIKTVQPGWLLIHFAEGNPAPERRFHLLHQALLKWLGTSLNCRLQDIQSVYEKGELLGLNVFFSLKPQQGNLTVTVDNEVAKQYGTEYLEAVLSDAADFLTKHPEGFAHVALINRRHIAVILERVRNLAYVVHLENLDAHLSEDCKARLRQWLAHPNSNHYVIDSPGAIEPFQNPPQDEA